MLGGISRITPACAGSTSHTDSNHGRCKDHPRLRGEYAFWFLIACPDKGSPPLARGVLVKEAKIKHMPRITPACAGSTCRQLLHTFSAKDHPRLRGEYLRLHKLLMPATGSPPLARGVPILSSPLGRFPRITPACAGSTVVLLWLEVDIRDHPRLRGEYTKKSLILRDPCLLV